MSSSNSNQIRPSYYLEINGKPCCISNVHPKASPPFACGHGSDLASAEEHRLRVLRDHPDAVVVIRDGGCPASAEVNAAQDERRALEEDWNDQDDAIDLARRQTSQLTMGDSVELLEENTAVIVTFLGLLVDADDVVCAVVRVPDRDLLQAVHFSRVRPVDATRDD